jgi:hypothetical protein
LYPPKIQIYFPAGRWIPAQAPKVMHENAVESTSETLRLAGLEIVSDAFEISGSASKSPKGAFAESATTLPRKQVGDEFVGVKREDSHQAL